MDDVGSFILVLIIGFCIGVLVGSFSTQATYEKNAIQRGYATYCPDTGNFAWKDECE